MNERGALIGKQNESKKKFKPNEHIQNKESLVKFVHIGRCFELATTTKIYINRLYLNEIRKEFL